LCHRNDDLSISRHSQSRQMGSREAVRPHPTRRAETTIRTAPRSQPNLGAFCQRSADCLCCCGAAQRAGQPSAGRRAAEAEPPAGRRRDRSCDAPPTALRKPIFAPKSIFAPESSLGGCGKTKISPAAHPLRRGRNGRSFRMRSNMSGIYLTLRKPEGPSRRVLARQIRGCPRPRG
jgi:hypothetical protein